MQLIETKRQAIRECLALWCRSMKLIDQMKNTSIRAKQNFQDARLAGTGEGSLRL
jgi:hypothetical protein